MYLKPGLPWKTLAPMRVGPLLEALSADAVLGPALKDVVLAGCRVSVLTGELPASKQKPDISDEHCCNMDDLCHDMTVGELAKRACCGDRLFIRVELPKFGPLRFPPHPPPLIFTPTILGGIETWYETSLLDDGGKPAPFFLTEAQHTELHRFINEAPSCFPQLLMPVGTAKSGKTTLLRQVIPGMVAAKYRSRWRKNRRKPVFFYYSFPPQERLSRTLYDFEEALRQFGKAINIPYYPYTMCKERTHDSGSEYVAIGVASHRVRDFVQDIATCGGELWLLLDELQTPILRNAPDRESHFMHLINYLVAEVSNLGRVVVTGNGVFSLLNAMCDPYLIDLWIGGSFLRFGQRPSRAVALDIARRIIAARAAAQRWSRETQEHITAETVLAKLGEGARERLASPRPALLADVLAGVGGAAATGNPATALEAAVESAVAEVVEEAKHDAARALDALRLSPPTLFRDVAVGEYTVKDLVASLKARHNEPGPGSRLVPGPCEYIDFVDCLRETGKGYDVLSLLPPYGALIKALVRPDGRLAVKVDRKNTLRLDMETTKNLAFILNHHKQVRAPLRHAVGTAVLECLAENGVGTTASSGGGVEAARGRMRLPVNATEFRSIAALAAFQSILPAQQEAAAPATAALRQEAETRFVRSTGWELLLAFRLFDAHAWLQEKNPLSSDRLTPAAVAAAVRAAVDLLVHWRHGCFDKDLDALARDDLLVLAPRVPRSSTTPAAPSFFDNDTDND